MRLQDLPHVMTWDADARVKLPEAPQTTSSNLYNTLVCNTLFSSHSIFSLSLDMDSLVAQYSQPAFERETYSEDEQLELYQPTPSLSLKFAMPPVAQVSVDFIFAELARALEIHGSDGFAGRTLTKTSCTRTKEEQCG